MSPNGFGGNVLHPGALNVDASMARRTKDARAHGISLFNKKTRESDELCMSNQ